MKKSDFVHLHVHSEYSLLDGACRVDDLVKTAEQMHMPALALTDHGNLFGVIDFYQKAMGRKIRPIIGYEAYVAPGSRFERDAKGMKDAAYHLTLLARNAQGYKNLMKLATAAYLEGFYYRPRIDKELLAKHAEGLIGLSGCLKSEMSVLCVNGHVKEAADVAGQYAAMFGPGHFYVELQNNDMAEQKKCMAGLLEVAKRTGLPTVATNDIHYMHSDDAKAHEVLLCINTGKTLEDEKRMKFSTGEFFFKSDEQMKELFRDHPEAIQNTLRIAEMCHVEMEFGRKLLPRFNVPEGTTPAEYLRKLCYEGAARRYGQITDEVRQRLEYELKVIEQTGFVAYFLIVWDFIRFARERGIPATGRGSGAGSIVAYVLDITNIDPVRYGLLFERFLNAERISMPDLDIDFCADAREQVIQYVRQKYGEKSVARIITFGTMMARGAIRDVGRALGIPLAEVDQIAKKIPKELGITLAEALKRQETGLKEACDQNPRGKELFDMAMWLEGLCRNMSVHAAGVVIADGELTDFVPLALVQNNKVVVTQFDGETLSDKVGMLKMDFLGVRTLTVINKALALIKQTQGKDVNLDAIPLDDKPTFELLTRGDVEGLFQLEKSEGMRDLIRRLKATNFDDLVPVLALYRPGPLKSGMVDQFIERRHGRAPIEYVHPSLEPLLKDTYGVILYQEQVMRTASALGGFTLNQADSLRKAMGKKIPEIMAGYRDQFVTGAVKNRIPQATATQIFDLMEYFAGYGFNKSHSAAYAVLSYHTAYLKANYPTEYMAALMSCEMGNTDKMAEYMDDCRRMGLEVLPPCVNESAAEFLVVGPMRIRFGLSAIKGLGSKAIESILEARKKIGKFESLFHFAEHVDLRTANKAVMEGLIKSGAFDAFRCRRAQLMAALDRALEMGAQAQHDHKTGQMNLFGRPAASADKRDARADLASLPDVPEWPDKQLLAFEREAFGFYVSNHPLARYQSVLKLFSTTSTSRLGETPDRAEVIVGGMVLRADLGLTKRGDPMITGEIEDMEGTTRFIMFKEQVAKFKDIVKPDAILFLRGGVDTVQSPSIRIADVIPIENAYERLTGRVTIKLSAGADAGLSEERLTALRDLLAAHPGQCPVFLEMEAENRRTLIRVGQRLAVLPSQKFSAAVSNLLGEGHLAFGPSNGSNAR